MLATLALKLQVTYKVNTILKTQILEHNNSIPYVVTTIDSYISLKVTSYIQGEYDTEDKNQRELQINTIGGDNNCWLH